MSKATGLNDEGSYVDVNGTRLYCRGVGDGPPFMILHGGPGLSHDYQYAALTGLLADRFRLIFYDQRGSGRSDGADDRESLTMETFVEDVEGLRLALGLGRLNLAGHSFGGHIAMRYAITYPEHLSSLILIDSEAASEAVRLPYLRAYQDEHFTVSDQQRLDELRASEGFDSDPAMFEAFFKIITDSYFFDRSKADLLPMKMSAEAIAKFRVTNAAIREDIGDFDFHDRLGSISCPTLVLHAESGPLSPDGAMAIAERIDGATLVMFEACGHFLYIEKPDDFAGAIEAFFDTLRAGSRA